MVRTRLVTSGDMKAGRMNEAARSYVTAAAQSAAAARLEGLLTDEETEVYKRGRNAKGRVPRHASTADYRRASGLECLFGWLYLTGGEARARLLFDAAFLGGEVMQP